MVFNHETTWVFRIVLSHAQPFALNNANTFDKQFFKNKQDTCWNKP